MAGKTVKKKKYRLKKSVRRTIATLLMITAIIVAAVPAPKIEASGEKNRTYTVDDIIWTFDVNSDNKA